MPSAGRSTATVGASVHMAAQEHEEDERWRPHVIMPKKEPFDDVLLGPLLGQGSFGRVYRGIWNGAQVAIKACPHTPLHGDRIVSDLERAFVLP